VAAALAAALVLAVAGPPPATFEAGAVNAKLAVSSWCWGRHCGAPISAATKTLAVKRGSTIQVVLGFAPLHARVSVAGKQMPAVVSGRELTWRATRGGGLTISVSARPGFVVYVGRIRLR
jgi:hypothetical protein